MKPLCMKIGTSGLSPVVVILLLAATTPVQAFWRLLCHGTLGTARIDPLVNFGQIAPHAHNIAGASNFNFFSDASDLMASNCTSCSVAEDRSVYWTPALYFKHDNGSFELVPTAGGMTVYYFNDNTGLVNDTNGNLVPTLPLTAFPPGFRMLAGNTSLRNFPYPIPDRDMSNWELSDQTQEALVAKAIGFNCLNYTTGYVAEGAMEFHYLRNKTFLDATCLDGVRMEIEFPSCWNGKDLDSKDHKSHILYPNFIKTGDCPYGFNVRTPVIFYETIWQTYNFVNYTGIFVIANGDTEGYGYHGDFYSGWDQSFLQNAVSHCTNGSGLQEDCEYFTIQDDSIATSCTLDLPAELLDEDIQGPMPSLPGGIPISTGPALAAEMKGTPVAGIKTPPPMALPAASTFVESTTAGEAPPAAASSSTDNPAAQPSATTAPGSTYAAAATSLTSNSGSQASATMTPHSTSAAPPPVTTPAASTNASNVPQILTTSTYTTGGQEVHLVLYEETCTVTQTEIDGPAKRHLHKHGHGRYRR